MWRHPLLRGLCIAYVGWAAWHWFTTRPVHPPDGVMAPDEPRQQDVPPGDRRPHGRWTLEVRASYQITARILSVERYHFDALAGLVPEDLALGWGPMSDNRVLHSMEITQSMRFYYWHASRGLPLPRDSITAHSANTHVIPEDAYIARQLAALRPGQVVTLTGNLVDGRRDDGAWLRTSLLRTDSGAGACEVMLVSEVSVER